MNLGERVRNTPMVPSPLDLHGIVKRSKRWYVVWCWLTFLIAPVVSIAIGILSAVATPGAS